MSKGKVTEVSVADLVPDDLNFNRGTEYGNALLEKSIQKFGAGRSILLDKNNRIIAGNKAAGKYGELGGEKVIVVETTGDTLVAVKRTDVDLDSQAGRELALADNATQRADLEWDTEVIKEAQEKWGLDADAWGVEIPEELAQTDAKEDDFDADAEVETRCKAGDIWQLGEHRLMCGDSTKAETFDQLLQGREARLVVTSPPYGVGKAYEEAGIEPWRNTIFAVIENITKHARIIVWNIGDLFATGTQFIEPTSMYSTEKMKQCGFGLMYSRIWKKPGGNFAGTNPYYTVSMKPVQEYEWILGYAKESYEKDYKPIIDYLANEATKAKLDNSILKEITGAGFMYGHWFTSHQFAFIDEKNYSKISSYCKKANIDAFRKPYSEIRREFDNLNIYGKVLSKEEESAWGQYAVWEISPVNTRTGGHPAEFPIELPSRCIKMHSRPGDIILEPFCGAGTTLIAAEQLGRICYGVEYDPHYCDVILARWEQFTGKTAVRL